MTPSENAQFTELNSMLKECVTAIEQGNKVVPQSVRGYLKLLKDREERQRDIMIRQAKEKEDEERETLHKLTKKYKDKPLYVDIPGYDPNESD